MRRFLLAAALFGTACGAQAADMPDVLRGSFAPPPATRVWEGWYVGGQASYSSAEIDFSHAPKTLTNFMLRNSVLQGPVSEWALLSKNHGQATGFGGFVGRNFQWTDIVLGVEANYNYINSLAASSSNSMGLGIVNPAGSSPPDGHTYTYNTTLSGNAALQIKDVLTFRGRAGWAAGGWLPYMFGGVAVGRMDVARSAAINFNRQDDFDTQTQTIQGFDPVTGTPIITTTTQHHTVTSSTVAASQSEHRTDSFVVGWTAGLGFEYCLWGNLFMRGEYEYIRFLNVKDITVSTNNARVGIGYKF